jgi:hypothetical protein
MPEDEPLDFSASDATDAEPEQRASRWSSIFTPRTNGRVSDSEMRQRMRTLDDTERKLAWAAGAIALLISLTYIPRLSHKTVTWTSEPFGKHHSCAYTLVKKTCELKTITFPSDYIGFFLLLIVLGFVILACAYWRKRSLTIFASLLAGFFSSIVGLLLIGYAAWLLMRSWRLSRYGAKDGATARKVALERAAERRELRKSTPRDARAARAPRSKGPTPPTKSTVSRSKRYTPKAKSRRR